MSVGWLAKKRTLGASLVPGLVLTFTIAGAAQFLSKHYGAPVMLFALLIGMAFHFLADNEKCVPGISFACKPMLKIGIALLGARVTIGEIASLGPVPVLMIPVLIILTILAGIVLVKLLGRPFGFGLLTGGAVAICGASAALALSAVLPRNKELERDTLFTVVAVTSLSTLSMIIYPILFHMLGFNEREVGVLIGATIHDVAQVVGAGYGVSDSAGDVATFVKLLRVACLPIVILGLALIFRGRAQPEEKFAFPWFAVAFGVILGVNSLGLIPDLVLIGMEWISRWFLVVAIAALGVRTSLQAMAALGPRHLGVVVLESAFLLLAAMGIVHVFM